MSREDYDENAAFCSRWKSLSCIGTVRHVHRLHTAAAASATEDEEEVSYMEPSHQHHSQDFAKCFPFGEISKYHPFNQTYFSSSVFLRDGSTAYLNHKSTGGEKVSGVKSETWAQKVNNIKKTLQVLETKGVDVAGVKADELADGDLKSTLLLMNNFRKRYDSQYNQNDGSKDWPEERPSNRTQSYRYDNHAYLADNHPNLPYKSADFSNRSDHVNGNLSMLPGILAKENTDVLPRTPPEHLVSKTELDMHGMVSQHGVSERRQHLTSSSSSSAHHRPVPPPRPHTAKADICPKPAPAPPVGQAWTSSSTSAWTRGNTAATPLRDAVSHTVEERLRSLLFNGPSTLPPSVQQNLQNGYEDGEVLELPPPRPRDTYHGGGGDMRVPEKTTPHPFSSGYHGEQPSPLYSSSTEDHQQGYVPSHPTEKVPGPRSQALLDRGKFSPTMQHSHPATSASPSRQFGGPPPYPGRNAQFQNVSSSKYGSNTDTQSPRMPRYNNAGDHSNSMPGGSSYGNSYGMPPGDRSNDGPHTENRLSPSKQYPGDPSRPVSVVTGESSLNQRPLSSGYHDAKYQGDRRGSHGNQLHEDQSNPQHGAPTVQRMPTTDLRDACSRFYGRENRSNSLNSPKPVRSADTQKGLPITAYNPSSTQNSQQPHHYNASSYNSVPHSHHTQSKPVQPLETAPRTSPMGQSDSPASHNSSQASDTGFMKPSMYIDRRIPVPLTKDNNLKQQTAVTSMSKSGIYDEHTPLPKTNNMNNNVNSWNVQVEDSFKKQQFLSNNNKKDSQDLDVQNGNHQDENWRSKNTSSKINYVSKSPVLPPKIHDKRNSFEMQTRTIDKPPSGFQGPSSSSSKLLITSTPNVLSSNTNKNHRPSPWNKYYHNRAFNDRNSEFSSSERSVTPPLPPLSPDNTPPATPPESPVLASHPGRHHGRSVSVGVSLSSKQRTPNLRTPDLVTSTAHRPGPGSTSSGGSRRRRHRRASMAEGLRKWEGGRHRRGTPMALRVSPTKPNPKRTSYSLTQLDDLNESLDDSSDDNGDASNTDATENNGDSQDIRMVQQQLSGLETMYQEILQMLGVDKDYISSKAKLNSSMNSMSNTPGKGQQRSRSRSNGSFRKRARENTKVGRRFQRLESHVVTLARSVAHLSSEMRSQNAMLQEIDDIKKELRYLKDLQRAGHSSHPHMSDFERFRGWVPSLTNPKRIRKLTKFFGQEPPLLHIFLKKLGYERYVTNFEHEKIGMMELPYMTEERLQKIGIPMGPRLRILQESQLCFRQENFDIYIV